jgi:hypothetical protein
MLVRPPRLCSLSRSVAPNAQMSVHPEIHLFVDPSRGANPVYGPKTAVYARDNPRSNTRAWFRVRSDRCFELKSSLSADRRDRYSPLIAVLPSVFEISKISIVETGTKQTAVSKTGFDRYTPCITGVSLFELARIWRRDETRTRGCRSAISPDFGRSSADVCVPWETEGGVSASVDRPESSVE